MKSAAKPPYSSVWDVFVILVLSMGIVPTLVTMGFDCLSGIGTMASPTGQLGQLKMAMAVSAQEAALFLLTWGVMWSVGQDLATVGLLWRNPWQDILWGIGIGVVCIVISPLSEHLSRLIFSLFLDESTVLEMLFRENMLASNLIFHGQPRWLRLYMGILVVFIAPIAEETFFRGYAYSVFHQRWGSVGALLLSSLLFAVVHMYVIHFLPVFLLGLLLGLAYEWRKTLVTPIVAHGVMNLLVATAVYFS
ncbi:MAG: CPBP family intramembrane metalloprotease [Firmicutes bacterium]|nr:CPBP family intramembrane metalloprotease [Bacillota bacterium]